MLKRDRSKPARAVVDPDLQRDRFGHNGVGAVPHYSRVTYLAHAKGWVMARRPGCSPWAIPEKLWRSFDYWTGEQPRTKAHTSAPVHPSATETLIGDDPNPLLDLAGVSDVMRGQTCGVTDARGWSCCGKPDDCSRAAKPAGYPDDGAGDIPAVNPSDLNCC